MDSGIPLRGCFLHIFLCRDVAKMGGIPRPNVSRYQSLSSEKCSVPRSDHL